MTLTRGHLLRHFQGKRGGFYPAMLDVAQDHLLVHLHKQGLFDRGLVFKGGTSLRKMRAGALGRFSTDVDFCAPDPALAPLVMSAVDGLRFGPFSFQLAERNSSGRRADLLVTGPFGPNANTATLVGITSKVELSTRPPWLRPDILPFLKLPVHSCYDLPGGLPKLPVARLEEAIAEKLARYSRIPLARDLYDLVWYAEHTELDERLVRRMWVLKVYYDAVLDELWTMDSFAPDSILAPRSESDIDEESIGYLTQPVDIPGWERSFRKRYAFLADLTEEERFWSACDPSQLAEYKRTVIALRETSWDAPEAEPTG